MHEIVIHSWEQLQSAIFENVWDGTIRRYRDNRFYRGGADADWTLAPSLNRACPQDLKLEQMMLRSLMKYGYAELQNCASFWEVVAMGQQFGLPTRLLDWTYSPLVAATCGSASAPSPRTSSANAAAIPKRRARSSSVAR